MSVATVEQGGPWTLDDWFEMNEMSSGARYELIDGGLLVTPAPDNDHQAAGDELRMLLRLAAPSRYRVLTGPNVIVDEVQTVLIPDVAVGLRDASSSRSFRAASVSLVVEVVSPSSKAADQRLKPALFAAAGVPHYWRIELKPFRSQGGDKLPVVFMYTLDNGAYQLERRASAGNRVVVTEPFAIEFDPAELSDY